MHTQTDTHKHEQTSKHERTHKHAHVNSGDNVPAIWSFDPQIL